MTHTALARIHRSELSLLITDLYTLDKIFFKIYSVQLVKRVSLVPELGCEKSGIGSAIYTF